MQEITQVDFRTLTVAFTQNHQKLDNISVFQITNWQNVLIILWIKTKVTGPSRIDVRLIKTKGEITYEMKINGK